MGSKGRWFLRLVVRNNMDVGMDVQTVFTINGDTVLLERRMG